MNKMRNHSLFHSLFLKKENAYKDENLQVGPVCSEYTKLLEVLSSSYFHGFFDRSKWSKGHIS